MVTWTTGMKRTKKMSQVRTKSKENQTQRAWGRTEGATGCRARRRRTKVGRTPLLKEAMLCTLTLQLRVRSISEKRFRQELKGRLVMGVDVVRKENIMHGQTHQEEQTSLAS